MTRNLLTCVFGLAAALATAQTPAAALLENQYLRASISPTFDLFVHENPLNQGLIYPASSLDGNTRRLVYDATLMLGGVDPGGNILIHNTSAPDVQSYGFGPLDPATLQPINEDLFNQVWQVTGDELQAFVNDWNENGALDDPSLLTENLQKWPAKGNAWYITSYNLELGNLAPFHDRNGDGVYNPADGDFPVTGWIDNTVQPVMLMYCVFHSSRLVVHRTAWLNSCYQGDWREHTLFMTHRFESMSSEEAYDNYFGFRIDVDLGNFENDAFAYAGNRAMIAYNATATDPDIFGVTGYGNTPPAMIVQFVDGGEAPSDTTMDVLTYAVNGGPISAMGLPVNSFEDYAYLSGKWRDGSPLTVGGGGYGGDTPTTVAFDGNPVTGEGWNFAEALPSGDIRMFATQYKEKFQPLEQYTLHTAWTVVPNPDGDNLAPVANAYGLLDTISMAFPACFELTVGTTTPTLRQVGIAPNPAQDVLSLDVDMLSADVHVVDMLGRRWSVRTIGDSSLDVAHLPAGTYCLVNGSLRATFIKI